MSSVTVSVVSHQHAAFLPELFESLARCPEVAKVVLTVNLPELIPGFPPGLSGRVAVRHNATPAGFGVNHNAAFAECDTPYFAVLNPDIRFAGNPFSALLEGVGAEPAGVVAPAVLSPDGQCEDSARFFPAPLDLLAKALGRYDGRCHYSPGGEPVSPDWVAGMFMLFPSPVFRSVNGFDPGFFLYYEDVDLCARLRQAGHTVRLYPAVSVVHDARRSSRHSLRYFVWHLKSLLRFWRKHLGRFPRAGA